MKTEEKIVYSSKDALESMDGSLDFLSGYEFQDDKFSFKIDKDGRRMKLYIKFTKDNSAGWESYIKHNKPPEMAETDFAKIVFFRGLEAIQQDILEAAQEFVDENPEEDQEITEV